LLYKVRETWTGAQHVLVASTTYLGAFMVAVGVLVGPRDKLYTPEAWNEVLFRELVEELSPK
jgi:hypothetical protein